ASEFRDPEYSDLSHVNVPVFTIAELFWICSQAEQLAQLLLVAPDGLRGLLRTPFNLKLAAEILTSGVNAKDLTPIRTQSELLSRYWEHRVIAGTDSGLRELVLKTACERMIAARRLQTDRLNLISASNAAALEDLLSNHVLAEYQPSSAALPSRRVIA